ncbi:protein TIC 22-like, chloroplastic isoform X1 [Elaeis guineensis]|uniref:Protein TIC 22-like, chloroplastic n=1 Tax=Elaeis guineensis var. tenera TaxID=51953 RepID=A0A6I9Q9N7_ELAGV|nr:protein TIC 22-like, chloroplastic [Elaeis guineensis]
MPFPWTKPHPRTPIEPQSHPPNPFLPIQTHLSAFLSSISSSNPLKTHIDSAFESLGNALQSGLSRLASPSAPLRSPPWARLTPPPLAGDGPAHRFDLAMSTEAIEERLAGVPVYALSNSAEEFVLVAGVGSGKSLGLFCFKKEDAEALLDQMRSMNHDMRQGSKVVALALSKVFQLKLDGVAFRFIPDSSQVAHAIKVKEKVGSSVDGFSGVPVFQSKSLVLRSGNKRYRPFFFRKEDLEESLFRASRQQNKLNPALRTGDIQVRVLEEIINTMKGSSVSKWDDVVFIPPGLNVSVGVRETALG